MGAIRFSLDPRLVAALQTALPLNVLVATGTFKGDTFSALEFCFDKVVVIELSEALWADAAQRFADYLHVRILQGNSEDKLRELRNELQDQGVLYWLDAHWCAADVTASELAQYPLLDELQSIQKLSRDSVILIDDARLFLSPPLAPHEFTQWPDFHTIASSLISMSTEHELMVVNDVIVFFPKHANAAMKSFATSYGIDWLLAANCLKENGSFMQQLTEKEAVIKEKEAVIKEKEAVIKEKEAVIKEKDTVIHIIAEALMENRKIYGNTSPPGFIARMFSRSYEIFRPRLGNLNQYVPRPLTKKCANTTKSLGYHPLISITTPSFAQGEFIERTLVSVFDQNYPNLEFFVQDGGSKDNTVEVLKKHQTLLSGWVSEKDTGQSQAINLGLKKTSGEIMGWLNSDDLLLPGALYTVADYFNLHPDVDVVYGNRLLIDENDMEIGRWILPGHDNEVLSWVDYVPQETMFWRRRIWDKVGGQIDESFKFAMDWDLLLRFRDAGAKFGHIPQFLGAFRIHEHQKTSAAINVIGHMEMNRLRERVFGRIPENKEIRRRVLPYLTKHILMDMNYRVRQRLRKKI